MSDKRIPSLDGLRAVAIMMVIAQHLSSGHTIAMLDYLWRFQFGDLGVRIFFVISGFLITSLLRKEFRINGRIDLARFYLRRALRIFPAYYAFLAILALSALAGLQKLAAHDFLPSVVYLANYLPTPRVLAHTWSLAVEEQFYLLWPGLIILLGWHRAPFFALFLCVLAPLLRMQASLGVAVPETLWVGFENTGDAIAWGSLYALLRERIHFPRFTPLMAAYTSALTGGALFFLASAHIWPLFWNSIGVTLTNVLVVLVLHCVLEAPTTAHHRLLNTRLLIWIGTLSYSLYLWQQAFVYGGFKLTAPYNLIAIFFTAITSYYLIEKPFLRLKRRFGKPIPAQPN